MALTKVIGAGAEGLTLSSTSLTVANGLTLTDGNVTLASGHGIDFSATANSSGSMTGELLQDYEQGTWTPTITGGFSSVTISYLKASYTRIGEVVHIFLSMKFDGTNAGASFVLSGLPFTSKPASANYGNGTGAIGYSTLDTYLNNSVSTAYVSQNNTTFQFYTMGGSAVASNANASNDWLELTLMYPAQ